MVEQWSSKSHVWVRFLLSLLSLNLNKYSINFNKKKPKTIIFSKKIPYNLYGNNFIKKIFLFKNFFYKFNKISAKFDIKFYLLNKFYFISKFYLINKSFHNLTYFSSNNLIVFFFFNLMYKNRQSLVTNSFLNNFSEIMKFLSIEKTYYHYYMLNNFFLNYSRINLMYSTLLHTIDKIAHVQRNSLFCNPQNNFLIFNKNRFLTSTLLNKNTKKSKNLFSKLILLFPKNLSRLFFYNKIPHFTDYKKISSFSKFYFKKFFYNIKFLNIFKLNKLDWLTQTMARLTRFSFLLNSNDYLLSKLFFKFTSFLPFYNNFILLNFFHENNYYQTSQLMPNFNKTPNLNNYNFLKIIKNTSKSFFYLKSYKYSKFYKQFNISCNLDLIFLFYFKPLFFKYFFYFITKTTNKLFKVLSLLENNLYLKDFFFYSENNSIFSNNILPNSKFNYVLKKKMLKIFNYSKFPTITTIWHYNTLIRFLEFCSGKKVFIKFFNFLITNLSFSEKAQCLLWAQKVKYFRKVLGPRLFLNESLQIIYLSLKLKDPYILSNWIVSTMHKISFWKYKTFLRYIKYVLRYFFWVIFKDLKIKGIKFQLKGKISVAGNARTRTVFHNVGFTSHTTFNNKILYNLALVRSFTGVMALKLWIVF